MQVPCFSNRIRPVLLAGFVAGSFPSAAEAQAVALCSRQDPTDRVAGQLVEMTPDQWTIVARGRRTTIYRTDYEPCQATGGVQSAARKIVPPEAKDALKPLACATANAAAGAPRRTETLVFKGSNTIGTGVLPALIEAYADLAGASLNTIETGAGSETAIYELSAPDRADASCLRISVISGGSNSALAALIDREAQVGMSSRPFTDAEIAKLAALRPGMTRETIERVLALDALAIVVPAGNPVRSLELCEIAEIFSGKIRNWKGAGGPAGPITVHVRTALSGTFDSFRALVLETCGQRLSATAIPHASNEDLAAALARDPGGIGYLPLAGLVEDLAPLRIGGTCGLVHAPTRFSVKTEDYPLARRLFLYAPFPLSRHAQSFMDFIGSDRAEAAIAGTHAIAQAIERVSAGERSVTRTGVDAADPIALRNWRRDMAGAERLSVTYRFRSGSEELDVKAWQDIRRLVRALQRMPPGNAVLIAGFADSVGPEKKNRALARARAEAVKQALLGTGAPVSAAALLPRGYGEALPVACNDTGLGREKNRRVEIWLRN